MHRLLIKPQANDQKSMYCVLITTKRQVEAPVINEDKDSPY